MLADRGRSRALCRRARRGRRRGGPLPRRGCARADRGRLRAAAGDRRSARRARPGAAGPARGVAARTSPATARSATATPSAPSRQRRAHDRGRDRTIRAIPARRSRPMAWSPNTTRARTPTTSPPISMGPFSMHAVMARALKVPGNRFRLRTPPDSGGSFGVKQGVFPYIVLMALAARVAGRAGEMDRGPAGAPHRVGLGHQPPHPPRGRGRRRRPRARARLGPDRGRRRPYPRARAGDALPHARQSHRRLRHPPRRGAQPRGADQQDADRPQPRLRRTAGLLRARATDAAHRGRARASIRST